MAYRRPLRSFRLVASADAAPRPTRPAIKHAASVKGAGALMVARLAQKTRFADPALVAKWPALVGDDIAAMARPGRLSPGRSDRSLDVHVGDGAAATHIRFHESLIISRLAAYFGPGVVTRLKILAVNERLSRHPTDGNMADNAGAETPPSPVGLGRFRGGTS